MNRIVIVGGGLLGCAVALECARRGAEVEVLERSVVGAEASSAAAGILAPRLEAHGREPFRSIGIESLEMYADWVRSLGAEVGLAKTGLLRVVRPGDPEAAPDVDARWLDAGEARAIEPGLGEDIRGAWHLPEEATLDPRRLVQAVQVAAIATGVKFHAGYIVEGVSSEAVEVRGAKLRGRVVVCAGAWTAKVPGLERLPIRPVRGQLAELSGVPVRHVLFGTGGYLVPRRDGRVIAGTTVEEVGFERGNTVKGIQSVLATATGMIPRLSGASFDGAWSGFRPGTPDELPILGDHQGIFVASGHYRNGILLAPLTARWAADALLGGARPPAAYSPDRFA